MATRLLWGDLFTACYLATSAFNITPSLRLFVPTFEVENLAHDSGPTLVRAEYGYPRGSPDTNSKRRNPPLQLSIQRTHKWANSEPHGAARQQQAIAKTPAKWSAYQILSVIVAFVMLVYTIYFVSSIPKSHKRSWTYCLQRSATERPSTCHCIRCLHNLLNVLVQTLNGMR
jgi:hypothetical protein